MTSSFEPPPSWSSSTQQSQQQQLLVVNSRTAPGSRSRDRNENRSETDQIPSVSTSNHDYATTSRSGHINEEDWSDFPRSHSPLPNLIHQGESEEAISHPLSMRGTGTVHTVPTSPLLATSSSSFYLVEQSDSTLASLSEDFAVTTTTITSREQGYLLQVDETDQGSSSSNNNNNNNSEICDGLNYNSSIEDFLAKEMTDLSVKEREAVYDDLHGVAVAVKETTDLIQLKLAEFRTRLQQMVTTAQASVASGTSTNHHGGTAPTTISTYCHARSAFYQAWQQASGYLQDPKFQLMFLRSAQYEVEEAAIRMCQFFEEKLELFGPSKLTKNISIADLSAEDLKVLELGTMQLLPLKDRAGRPIMFMNPTLLCSFNPQTNSSDPTSRFESYLRTMFYMCMTMVQEDEDAQLKGWAGIIHMVEAEAAASPEPLAGLVQRACQLMGHLPTRMAACHLCYNSDGIKPWIRLGLQIVNKRDRMRVRLHLGSTIECRYALIGFGIPTYALPIHKFGGSNLEHHRLWVQRKKQQQIQQQIARHPQQDIPQTISFVSNPPLMKPPHGELLYSASKNRSLPNLRGTMNKQKASGVVLCPLPPKPTCYSSAACAPLAPPSSVLISTRHRKVESKPMPPKPVLLRSSSVPQTTSSSSSSSSSLPSSSMPPPQSEDVLLGRGIPVMNHPGNQYYRQLIAGHAERYEQGSKFDKTVIAEMVLKRVKEAGGRFLKPNPAAASTTMNNVKIMGNLSSLLDEGSFQWEEIDDQAARLKIASAFRFVRKQKRNKQQQHEQHYVQQAAA